ncbi:DUF2442 domain-containing protein [candidate division KSB1 bacterium]|nr:DUF2442 domain-containing protein [candidate division KSB1 bacterium]
MSTFEDSVRATRIWFDDHNLWTELADGRQLGVPLAYFPRLLNATKEQRQKYEISGGGTGLHWDEIDEDVSVEGLLFGVGDLTNPVMHEKSKVA